MNPRWVYILEMVPYRLPLIASIVLAGACDGLGFLAPGKVCTRELRTRFSPADTTIQVGQGFQASVQLSSCGGAEQLSDLVTWRAEDSTVATVDGQSGRVVGLQVSVHAPAP